MTPEMHTPCPVCGAMALTGSHRCRYCGEVLVDDLELAETEVERASAGVGTDNIALLVAIGSTALPVHAAISGFTPPYDIPIEAVALGPHVLVAVVLGFFVPGSS